MQLKLVSYTNSKKSSCITIQSLQFVLGNVKKVEKLIKTINVNAVNADGDSPLHWAARWGNFCIRHIQNSILIIRLWFV